MKFSMWSVLITLLIAGHSDKNTVYGDPVEDTSPGTESTSLGAESTSLGAESTSPGAESTSLGAESTSPGAESTSLGAESTSPGTQSTLPKPETTSSKNKTPSHSSSFDTTTSTITTSQSKTPSNTSPSTHADYSGINEIDDTKNSPFGRVAANLRLVRDVIPDAYNNSFVVTNFFNFSRDGKDILQIGDPFDFSFIENKNYQPFNWGQNLTTFLFSNIRAYNSPSKPVKMYYNNLTCTSGNLQIIFNIVPQNMTFEGNFLINDTSLNKSSNGTFTFSQSDAKLSYKIPFSEITKHNLTSYGDIIYADEKMKFTRSCLHNCDLLTNSAKMFNEVKKSILQQISLAEISKRTDTFITTFPFLSNCPSSSNSPQNNRYFYINDTETRKLNSHNLRLGPLVIKGFESFDHSTIIAAKNQTATVPNRFLIEVVTNQVQGQCDWEYFKVGEKIQIRYSFNFIIARVKFLVDAEFMKWWNIRNLKIDLVDMSVHRVNKESPKIHELTKHMLKDFLNVKITNSLKALFNQYIPKVQVTTTDPNLSEIKTTGTKEIVYVTNMGYTRSNADENTDSTNYLPFPGSRRNSTPCVDDRKWWQKILFYKNKCKTGKKK